MKHKIIGIFVCILLIVTSLPVAGAANVQNTSPDTPGLIGIKIVAKVYEVNDPHNLLGGAIDINDLITGKYVYDSETPDTDPNSSIGSYWQTSSPCRFEVKVGGFVFTTNPNEVNFCITIFNDFFLPIIDIYEVCSFQNLPLSNGMIVNRIDWSLSDYHATALPSDELPTTAPILEDWDAYNVLLLKGSDPSNPDKIFEVKAHVTKATKNSAVDINGAESNWRIPLVTLANSCNLSIIQFWIKIFERFPHIFPILRHLLG